MEDRAGRWQLDKEAESDGCWAAGMEPGDRGSSWLLE